MKKMRKFLFYFISMYVLFASSAVAQWRDAHTEDISATQYSGIGIKSVNTGTAVEVSPAEEEMDSVIQVVVWDGRNFSAHAEIAWYNYYTKDGNHVQLDNNEARDPDVVVKNVKDHTYHDIPANYFGVSPSDGLWAMVVYEHPNKVIRYEVWEWDGVSFKFNHAGNLTDVEEHGECRNANIDVNDNARVAITCACSKVEEIAPSFFATIHKVYGSTGWVNGSYMTDMVEISQIAYPYQDRSPDVSISAYSSGSDTISFVYLRKWFDPIAFAIKHALYVQQESVFDVAHSTIQGNAVNLQSSGSMGRPRIAAHQAGSTGDYQIVVASGGLGCDDDTYDSRIYNHGKQAGILSGVRVLNDLPDIRVGRNFEPVVTYPHDTDNVFAVAWNVELSDGHPSWAYGWDVFSSFYVISTGEQHPSPHPTPGWDYSIVNKGDFREGNQKVVSISGRFDTGSDVSYAFLDEYPFDGICCYGVMASSNTEDIVIKKSPRSGGNQHLRPGSAVIDNTVYPFKVYPNPSLGSFHISFHNSEMETFFSLEITDLNGKSIAKTELIGKEMGNHSEVMELSRFGLSPGAYILKAISSGQTYVKKVVIE